MYTNDRTIADMPAANAVDLAFAISFVQSVHYEHQYRHPVAKEARDTSQEYLQYLACVMLHNGFTDRPVEVRGIDKVTFTDLTKHAGKFDRIDQSVYEARKLLACGEMPDVNRVATSSLEDFTAFVVAVAKVFSSTASQKMASGLPVFLRKVNRAVNKHKSPAAYRRDTMGLPADGDVSGW